MAGWQDCRDLGTTAAPLARSEEHGIAVVDDRRARPHRGVLLPRRIASDPGASPHRRHLDRLRDVRFCRVAYADACDEEPDFLARLYLRYRRCLCLGPSAYRSAWTGRCRLRASPTLSAQQTASSSRILMSKRNRHPRLS